jgi:hypothetical protein
LVSCADSRSIFLNPESSAYRRRRKLPDNFWRTFYEDSHTLSRYVGNGKDINASSPDSHVDTVINQVNDGNAFQALKRFALRDSITEENILKHLNWKKKEDSSFISAFEDFRKLIGDPVWWLHS